jgi:hypothetical protein
MHSLCILLCYKVKRCRGGVLLITQWALPLHRLPALLERLCGKASGAVLSQPSQHDADHGQVDPGFFTAREQFIVLGESTPSGEPRECSFYHPTPLQHMKPLRPDLLPVHFGPLRDPDASQAAKGDARPPLPPSRVSPSPKPQNLLSCRRYPPR